MMQRVAEWAGAGLGRDSHTGQAVRPGPQALGSREPKLVTSGQPCVRAGLEQKDASCPSQSGEARFCCRDSPQISGAESHSDLAVPLLQIRISLQGLGWPMVQDAPAQGHFCVSPYFPSPPSGESCSGS